MSASKVDDVGCKFKWGKRGRGGKCGGQPVQFYESFTYDGIEYFLYDSVYLYTIDDSEPYIGKLLKAWEEHGTKIRRIKVLWFFRPVEIHNWLGNAKVQKNELFLASGEGVGLLGVNPLEVLVGKCNVICTSKDERNPQPSDKELSTAEYIFNRVFDVATLTISGKIADQIAGVEVKLLFNRSGGENSISSLKIHENGGVNVEPTMTRDDSLDFMKHTDAVVEGTASTPSNNDKADNERHQLLESTDAELPSTKKVQSASKHVNIEELPSTSDKLVDDDTLSRPSTLGNGNRSVKRPGVDPNENTGGAGIKDAENQHSVRDAGLSVNAKKMKIDDLQTTPCEESKSKGLTVPTLNKNEKNDVMVQKVKANLINNEGRSCDLVSSDGIVQKDKANSDKVEVKHSSAHFKDGPDSRNIQDSIMRKGKSKIPSKESLDVIEKIGDHEIDVIRRPDTDRSKWFKELPWGEQMKKARNQGTIVLLSNLDPSYISSDVEDIISHAFQESCKAKVIQHPIFSTPQCGQAFVIFKTRDVADRVVKRLMRGCLMLPNGRPLVATKSVPPQDNLDKFVGHFAIDRLRVANREEWKRAVFSSHCSQPNTIEYEMALEWKLQRDISDKCWMELHKEQIEELESLRGQLKKK